MTKSPLVRDLESLLHQLERVMAFHDECGDLETAAEYDKVTTALGFILSKHTKPKRGKK